MNIIICKYIAQKLSKYLFDSDIVCVCEFVPVNNIGT